jgi:hypothetical protein
MYIKGKTTYKCGVQMYWDLETSRSGYIVEKNLLKTTIDRTYSKGRSSWVCNHWRERGAFISTEQGKHSTGSTHKSVHNVMKNDLIDPKASKVFTLGSG